MSAMRSSRRDGRRVEIATRPHPIDFAWVMFALAMLWLMKANPGVQTIPYHFIFVSFTLFYGFRLWSPRVTVLALLAISVLTGALFLQVYAAGDVSLDEVFEVPLMGAIVGGMAWHALRRASAQRRLEELAALETSRLERQREFLRDASHAIRTPVTIARGHIELLQQSLSAGEQQADADEVLHQLDRLHHLAARLLAIEQLQTTEELRGDGIDAAGFVSVVGRRWSHAAPRTWQIVAAPSGVMAGDERRLEEAVDAMVENAVRVTRPGDVVRLSCRRDGRSVVVAVEDSGPGIPAEDLPLVFDRFFHRQPGGQEPGTGLGLALVSAVASAHGGTVAAGGSELGGACVQMRLPADEGAGQASGVLAGHLPAPTPTETLPALPGSAAASTSA